MPQDLATRVMDLILAEGTIFIFQMGMAILKMSALDLLTLDMELMIRVSELALRHGECGSSLEEFGSLIFVSNKIFPSQIAWMEFWLIAHTGEGIMYRLVKSQ